MASAHQTKDHEEIRKWVEKKGGHPAQVEGTAGMLRKGHMNKFVRNS